MYFAKSVNRRNNNELEQIFLIQLKPANIFKCPCFVKPYLGYDLGCRRIVI